MSLARRTVRQRAHPGLDAYRGLAVLLMYVVHARRLQTTTTPDEGASEAALRLFMWSEPFIAASFLLIVGFSLVLSATKHGTGRHWLRRTWLRAAKLYVLSMLLFVPQFGLEWPDLALSSGILSAIAVAIALVGSALCSPRPAIAVAGVGIVGWLVTALLERMDASVSGINAGPGGTLPLVTFTAAGALLALCHQRRGWQGLLLATGVAAAALVIAWLDAGSWLEVHASHYHDYGGLLALSALLEGGPTSTTEVTFWNHSAVGALGLMFPLAASVSLFLVPENRLGHVWRRLGWLLLLGRHALGAYVGHLVALGLLELAGWGPGSATSTWLLVAALAVGACSGSAAWERFGSRPSRAVGGPNPDALSTHSSGRAE